MRTSSARPTVWACAIALGAATGGLVATRNWLWGAALVVTGLLTIVQTPIDLALHRLTRRVTVLALVAMVSLTVVHLVTSDVPAFATIVIPALGVTATFAVLHFASPRSLGWGDVLIVAPLSLAVAAVSPARVIPWLLFACCTAGVHGVLLRVKRGERFVPFGPHLMVAAWLTQAVAV